jgi:hypothetical protein
MKNPIRRFELFFLRPLWGATVIFTVIAAITSHWWWAGGGVLAIMYFGVIGAKLHPSLSAGELAEGPLEGQAAVAEMRSIRRRQARTRGARLQSGRASGPRGARRISSRGRRLALVHQPAGSILRLRVFWWNSAGGCGTVSKSAQAVEVISESLAPASFGRGDTPQRLSPPTSRH